jgi:hypothetical protein
VPPLSKPPSSCLESEVRRIVTPARTALDNEIVDLAPLGVHQHRAAMSAAIVDGVGAGDQDWWGSYDSADSRMIYEPKTDSRMRLVAHRKPLFRREHEHSQPPTPGRAFVGDTGSLEFPANQSRVRRNRGSMGNKFMRYVFLRIGEALQMAA